MTRITTVSRPHVLWSAPLTRRVLLVPLAVLAAGALAACSVYIDARDPDRGRQTTQERAVLAVTVLDLGASGDVRLSVGGAVAGGHRRCERAARPQHAGQGRHADHRPGPPSGRIDLTALDADTLRVSVDGSGGVVVGHVTATSTALEIAGSGRVRLAGLTGSLDVSIPGSGSADVGALEARDARASIAGSGAAHVNATRTLDASISGSGAITYSGDPRVTSHASGSGSITRG